MTFPFLSNEKILAQAAIQAAEADVASLENQIESGKQALAGAQADAEAARARLNARLAERPGLEASAASADDDVAAIDRQIADLEQDEPEQTIERANKPPLPNPAWRTWKKQLDALIGQRNQAEAEAGAAHARLTTLNGAISQATADIQAAETRSAQAAASIGQLDQALAAAKARLSAARQALDDLTDWSDEIDRTSLDRPALEEAAAALSARVLELEDLYADARAALRKADAALSSLTSRREELVSALADVNGQLPAANDEVNAADLAAADLAQQIDDHISGGV